MSDVQTDTKTIKITVLPPIPPPPSKKGECNDRQKDN